MIPVKIENVSSTEHHTVRLTPVNGETVDPTTLVGAALWSDDLSMCLSPQPKDLTCNGVTDAVYITKLDPPLEALMVLINDFDYGSLMDIETGLINVEMVGEMLHITNLSDECIRVVIDAERSDGPINENSIEFLQGKPVPYHEFDPAGSSNAIRIDLAPSRIGQVAIDFRYQIDGVTTTEPIFGNQTIDLVIETKSLLPVDGLAFIFNNEYYHLAHGQQSLVIPYPVDSNPSRYPITVTPAIEVLEPQYLLGGSLAGIPAVTIKPEGFNYNIPVTIIGNGIETSRQSSVADPTVSFFVGYPNDFYLSKGQVEYTIKLDPSFAGAELRCYPTFAIDSLMGVLDSNGECTFKTPNHWTMRKEQDLGLRLHTPNVADAFYFIHGIYASGTEPSIYSDTVNNIKEVQVSLSEGFGNKLTIDNIPPEILEIVISNDNYSHAANVSTPFNTPKRVTRASGDVPFEVIPDKPTKAYSSAVGSMTYYHNYIQIKFVVDGQELNQGQWFTYRLNVTN